MYASVCVATTSVRVRSGSYNPQVSMYTSALPPPELVKMRKAAVFEASSVPFGFGNRSLYEASIRQPVGRDWNTAATTKRQTQQEVVTRLGNVIAPLKMTKGRKATKRRPLAR